MGFLARTQVYSFPDKLALVWGTQDSGSRAYLNHPPFMGRWEYSVMDMFTCYFDASGAPDQGAALSVAGFVAKAEQ